MIRQAIIPLAGLGTRLLPLTSVYAKELLPINGKVGLEYIIEECMVEIRRILVVCLGEPPTEFRFCYDDEDENKKTQEKQVSNQKIKIFFSVSEGA